MNQTNDQEEDGINNDDATEKTLQELVQCSSCLRRMRQEVFVKHPNVCRENPVNKRSVHVFDITQYRSVRAGDKIIPIRKVSPINANKSSNNHVRPSQTRSAKRDRRSGALIPPIINNFCCPTCKRKFCEKAYDRHVVFCSTKIKQIQQPPSEEILLARLQLDRRIKFSSTRNSSSVITTPIHQHISNPVTTKEPIKQYCFLSLRKNLSSSLARCPWCSKPYMPNCVHYCQYSKDLFSDEKHNIVIV